MIELPKNHGRYLVPGLARGLEILTVLADAGEPLSAAEIAKRMGVTRSSIFRLLYTLQHLGYVEEAQGGGGHDLSARVLSLGYAYLAGRDMVGVARPVLRALAQETGFSTHLGILSDREVVYLMHAPGRAGYVSAINAGDRLEAHASPVGLVLLAGLGEDALQALFGDSRTLQRIENASTTPARIIQAVHKAREEGYAISHDSAGHGGRSVAAAVRGFDGDVKAAISITGPSSAFRLNELEDRLCPQVRAAAADISRKLGADRNRQ